MLFRSLAKILAKIMAKILAKIMAKILAKIKAKILAKILAVRPYRRRRENKGGVRVGRELIVSTPHPPKKGDTTNVCFCYVSPGRTYVRNDDS